MCLNSRQIAELRHKYMCFNKIHDITQNTLTYTTPALNGKKALKKTNSLEPRYVVSKKNCKFA